MRQRLSTALRGLWSDDWVLGIAVAAALALSATDLLRAAAGLVTSVIDQPDFDVADGLFSSPWTLTIGGRTLFFEPLVQSLLAFAAVVVVAALVRRTTRGERGDSEPSEP